jgi:hypothetical protein
MPLTGDIANINIKIGSTEETYKWSRHYVLSLTAAFLVFVVEEFVALLLGGALRALGVPFQFYALLLCTFLRSLVILHKQIGMLQDRVRSTRPLLRTEDVDTGSRV